MSKEAEKALSILANMLVAGTILYSILQIMQAEPIKHPKVVEKK